MPNIPDPSYSRYDNMSDEQLRHILRDDASKPEGEDTDMEMILYVMEVLAKRRNQRNEGKAPAEALASFKNNYTDNETNFISEKRDCSRKTFKVSYFKRIAVAAAVLVLILGSAITVQAWDFGLWEIIANWTQETFHFRYWDDADSTEAPTAELNYPCVSLQAALDEYKISQKLVPAWLPEGYIEGNIDIHESPRQRRIYASYQNDNEKIQIRIADYLGATPNQVEQSGTLLEIYESGENQYYIFDNYDFIHTVWTINSYECDIAGTVSLEEMKLIIDSIERG